MFYLKTVHTYPSVHHILYAKNSSREAVYVNVVCMEYKDEKYINAGDRSELYEAETGVL